MSSFLVYLKIKESTFQGTILYKKKKYSGNFIRVAEDIFILKLKVKVEFCFKDKIELTSRTKTFIPLIPLFTESNKKKLTKNARSLNDKWDDLSKKEAIILTLKIEKVLNMVDMKDFLSMKSDELLQILIGLEADKELKLLDIKNLHACSYKVFVDNFSSMVEKLTTSYNSRVKSVKFSDLSSKIIFHPDSIYFRYILEKSRERQNFRILKDKLVFTELPLSDKETSVVNEVENIIKKNKLGVFSIYSIRKVSGIEIEKINNSLWHMLSEEKIVPLDDKKEYFIFHEELAKIINRLKKFKRNQGELIDISSFREISVLNRKNIILVLEYLDSQNITKRIGNNRKIELQV